MASIYRIDRVRGGKDDSAIERGLRYGEAYLRPGSLFTIRLDRFSPWKGKDKVEFLNYLVLFHDRDNYTFSPVAIQAAVRVLHRYGYRGFFQISVNRDILTIQPYSSAYIPPK